MNDSPADTTAYARLRDLVLRIADGRPLSHRWLADQVGCSASRIPLFLRRMEQAGEIRRTPHKNTHAITPLNVQGEDADTPERSPLNVQPPPLIDQAERSAPPPDRSGGSGQQW